MLEWLLRKIFGIKKPEPKEKRAARKPVREEMAQQQSDAGKTGSSVSEPSVDMSSVHPLVPRDDLEDKNAVAVSTTTPVTGTVPPEAADTASAYQKLAEEKEARVHIFNFRAWFYADPVKAALTLGLAFLSWLATYTGMLELIQANTGSLDIGSRVAIGFAVMMLMLMILYLLDSLYSGGTPTWLKPIFVFGYLFLTLISVGFGFGFYWKYLEAQTEATRSAESAVSQVQVALQIGQSRLEQLQSTFAQLTTISTTKATQERDHGNSCPNSSPGEGPRMRLRDSDSQKFDYAAQYITGRADTVNKDLKALNADLKKIVSRDASTVGADGTRNKFLRSLGRKLDLTIARFNTLRTDPQLRQFRDSFDKRAGTTVFPNGRGGTFRCPDVQLQTALRGVVRAIDDIPEIKNPKIAAVEGSEAIVEAFRRLAVTLAALPTLKLPPSPEELRKARKQAISAGRKVEVSNIDPGLSKRDYIPLSAAIFVDLCILLISLNRRYNNFEKLQRSVASARAGEIGNTVLDIFEAHKNRISQEMLEIFHHAEFEYGRDYYLAVPLIKGSKKALLNERLHAKQIEISRSAHAALDHKIEILDEKLQKLKKERSELESMKVQLTNHKNRLMAQSGGHDEQSFVEQFVKLDRLMNGNFQRIQQTKTEIGQLKEQRIAIHKRDEEILKGQLESDAELDLAREARFLSNLCVSLEANNILHLASIYPFQRQVRARLKKHNSRYYAEGRHYRVYRFRKVADTQSQMVLDLIMEASRRARENGELLLDEDLVVTAKEEPKADIPEAQEDKEIVPPELVALNAKKDTELEEMREMLLGFKKEAAAQLAEIKDLTKEAVTRNTPEIDHEAPVLETLRVLSPEEQTRLSKALGAHVTGVAGLGVKSRDLEALQAEDRPTGEGDLKEEDETVRNEGTALVKPDEEEKKDKPKIIPAELAQTDTSPRMMTRMLGNLFSSKSPATPQTGKTETSEAGNEGEEIPGTEVEPRFEENEEKEQEKEKGKRTVATISERLASVRADAEPGVIGPALADPVLADPAPAEPGLSEPALVAEREPFVATPPEPLPAKEARRVNEDSLLPPSMTGNSSQANNDRPVTGPSLDDGTFANSSPVPPRTRDLPPAAGSDKQKHDRKDQSLPELTDVKERLRSRVKKLDDGTGGIRKATTGSAALVAGDQSLADGSDAPLASGGLTAGSAPVRKTVLTDPVVLAPGDSSQDPIDSLVPGRPAGRDILEDEPSEADKFEEGAIPGFLRSDPLDDDVSEEMSIQSMARRLSPDKKDS